MESVASSVSLNQPWVAAGDFNVIAAAEECEGGPPANVRNMDEFNAAMFNCGLSVIDFDGSHFTWTNGSVWQHLDRALGNRLWSEAYPLSRVSHMARGRSDHSPLLIKCAGNRVGSSCFRFLNIWRRHPQFREIVLEAWNKEVYGMEMVRFYNKLEMVRDKLKQWNHEVFGNVSSKVAEAEQELKQRESEISSKGMEQPKSWSHSLLVLIAKVEGASHWREFQPISFCNELVLDLDRRLIDPNLILKLDMEKAYDRVDWSFLLFMLTQYGFEEAVMDLLFRTFSNSWFSVLINGEPTGFVKSYQGDALLSIRDFLQLYQHCSSQKVNITKSAFYASSRITDTQLTLVSTTLGYQRQGFPFRYLGVPLIRGGVTCAGFDGLLAKVLQPPKAVLLHLGRVCKAFLWDTSTEAKRVHWVAWDKASIWAMFMHVKYVRGGHPLLVSPDRPSPVWRRLLEVRDLTKGNIRWCLGEGLVDFWQDRWCSDVPLASLVPGPKSHRLVGEFFLSDGWDEQWLRLLLPGHLVSKILELRIFPNTRDQMIWAASPSGSFTMSSAWEVLLSKHNWSTIDSLVWSSVVPLKISLFAWRLLLGWLPLDDLLQASSVWWHFSHVFGLMVQGSGVATRLASWLLSHRFVSQSHIRVILPLLILWFLWKGRNKDHLEGTSMSSDQIINQVCAFLDQLGRGGLLKVEYFKGDTDCAWVHYGKVKEKLVQLRAFSWVKPLGQAVNLNTNASVVSGRAMGGGVVRSTKGDLVFAFYKEFGEQDILSAEALALQEGLRSCQDNNLLGFVVEVDSSTLVSVVSSKMPSRWPLCNIIRHIQFLVANLGVSLVHTFREANAVADALASLNLRSDVRFSSAADLPSKVWSLLQFDKLSTPCQKIYYIPLGATHDKVAFIMKMKNGSGLKIGKCQRK
nr:uncharacterized protein LOC113743823 [Coffea arabica]